MDRSRDLMPAASALIVFETAGRMLNFTAAAKELGMSQAAVSLAIRRLEQQFGVYLFVRRHRRVELTEAGARFFADVSLGLSHIQKSAALLRGAATGNHVTLSVTTAFAALWMVPRLQQLHEDLPQIELRLHTSDRDLDLVAERIPLGIRYGEIADHPEYNLLALAQEEIYPVCSPAYIKMHGAPKTPKDLTEHRLIHLEEPHRPTVITWPQWLTASGVDRARPQRGLRINDYVSVIQSALEGQGVALGWAHLTDRIVKKGLLVRVTNKVMRTGKFYNVAWPKRTDIAGHVAAVRDWLVKQD